ncbi:restriction endonuclease subunit S [Treponema succinifaciens]|uniref:restriction endonuclease subunit S n=1 Tax=Treponema succinifaciens TaxID=167 RepID=UPI003FCD0D5E
MFGKIIDDSTKIPLEELCDFVTVGIANSATHAFCDEGVVMFRNQNIKEDFLDDSDIIHINTDFANKYKTKALKENDLLIVRTGYPGICCLVPKKYEGCQTFTTLIARLKKDENVNPKFICHYINSDYGREYVNKNQAGVAQQNFGATALSKMPISIPPIELQNDFASFVQQIDKSKFEIANSLKRLYNKGMLS